MDIQNCLDETEHDLTQGFVVNEQSRNRAREKAERSLTLSTPVCSFMSGIVKETIIKDKSFSTIGVLGF
jgi:hypothetical protein